MTWIQPLELKTWFVSVFSGTPEIFTAIAFMVIAGLSAYFRMNGIAMFFMLGLFILMFSDVVAPSFVILFGLIGGLLVGYWISKIVSR